MYVEMRHIHKTFDGFLASRDVSFGIEKGHLAALLGPSGSGKTTILRMIAGLDMPDSGDIVIDGRKANALPASKRGIGFVFQNFALIDNQTVLYNLLMAMKYRSLKKNEKLVEIEKVLEFVGLGGYQNKKIYELSGGEQQRIAIARAILKPHDLILADEPTGSLDDVNKQIIFELFEKLNEQGKTIIIVTHDFELAKKCKRVLKINSRHQVEEM